MNAPWSVSYSANLASRGLDFSGRGFMCSTEAKALAAAVRRHAGEAAMIRVVRCTSGAMVNRPLPEEHKLAVKKKLQNAYAMTEYADAKPCAGATASRTDGTESERRPAAWRRHG